MICTQCKIQGKCSTDSWSANCAAQSKEASLRFKASGRSKKTGDLSDFDCGDQAAGLRILEKHHNHLQGSQKTVAKREKI